MGVPMSTVSDELQLIQSITKENRGTINAYLNEQSGLLYLEFEDFVPHRFSQSQQTKVPFKKFVGDIDLNTGQGSSELKSVEISGLCQIAELKHKGQLSQSQLKDLSESMEIQVNNIFDKLPIFVEEKMNELQSESNDVEYDINEPEFESLQQAISTATSIEFCDDHGSHLKSSGMEPYMVNKEYHDNQMNLSPKSIEEIRRPQEILRSAFKAAQVIARLQQHSSYESDDETASVASSGIASSGIASSEDSEDDYQKAVFDDELSDSSEVSTTSTVPLRHHQSSDDDNLSTGSRMSPREMAKQRQQEQSASALPPISGADAARKKWQTGQDKDPGSPPKSSLAHSETNKSRRTYTIQPQSMITVDSTPMAPQLPPKLAPLQDLRKIGEKINSATDSSSPSSPGSTPSLPPLRRGK